MCRPTAGIFLFLSSLICFANGISLKCNTTTDTVVATLGTNDAQYINWTMVVYGGVSCSQSVSNVTSQTITVDCDYVLGNHTVKFWENSTISTSESDSQTTSVYCNATQSGLDFFNPPPGTTVEEMGMTSVIVHNIPIVMTMTVQTTSGINVGDAQQVVVELSTFSQNFARMLLTLRINNKDAFYDVVDEGCVKTPTQSSTPFTMTGEPANQAPGKLTIDFPMLLPDPLIPGGIISEPQVLTITAIAELCPEPSFTGCYIPGDCIGGANRLGRRRKRSTNPLAVVRETIIVFPDEATKQQLLSEIIAEESRKNPVYTIDYNKYCLDEALFVVVVVLLGIGVLASVITLLFFAIKYRISKLRKGSSSSGSTSSRKILFKDRPGSDSSEDRRQRDKYLADETSREYVNPRVYHQRNNGYPSNNSNDNRRDNHRGSRE